MFNQSNVIAANLTTTGSNTVKLETLEEISHYLYAIVFPIIFVLGIIGNALSSLLFSITKLNQTSCGIYFLLLAVADSVALIGGLHHCLTIGFRVPVPNATYCRARNFFLYTSMDISSWMVVAISVDRCLKVKYPIRARALATRRLAVIVSCVTTFIFVLKNIHLATDFIGDFTEDAADNCDPNPDHPSYMFFFQNIWPWLDLVTYALFPFIIVAICNGMIICDQYVRRVKLRQREIDRSLITLLLISSISLIVCNLPITIVNAIYPYISISYDTNDYYDVVAFVFDLLRLPSYASLGLNFYLYYYKSVLFRQQTIKLFRRICRMETPEKHGVYKLDNLNHNEPNRLDSRLNSVDDLDEEEEQEAPPLFNGRSFISNFYRRDS